MCPGKRTFLSFIENRNQLSHIVEKFPCMLPYFWRAEADLRSDGLRPYISCIGFSLSICLLLSFSTLVSAQDLPESPFTDAVEVLSIERLEPPVPQFDETMVYEGLVLSTRVFEDDENRAIRTSDGKIYPWPDEFGSAGLEVVSGIAAHNIVYVYKNQVFLRVRDAQDQTILTYWTLDLDTGEYTRRVENTVDTFCGSIQPSQLATRWLFTADGETMRLCSLYTNTLSAPLPENHTWFNDEYPFFISESPDKAVVILVGKQEYQYVFFRYEPSTDTFTRLGEADIYANGNRGDWVNDEVLVVTSVYYTNYTPIDTIVNVVDLRYDDVVSISANGFSIPADWVTLADDPLRVIVNERYTHRIVDGETETEREYCRYTVYNILERQRSDYFYGEFCNFVGGERSGPAYFLHDDHLWRFRRGDWTTFTRVVEGPIQQVQRRGETLILFTDEQVLRFDIPTETTTTLLDRDALLLMSEERVKNNRSSDLFFIIPEGLLRVNPQTKQQRLVFEGSISQVDWIDVERGTASLIYQVFEDGFPAYIPPMPQHGDQSWLEPSFSLGKLALVDLETGEVVFEIETEWTKQREVYPGFWLTDTVGLRGNTWYQITDRSSGKIVLFRQVGDRLVVIELESSEVGFGKGITAAENWLLIQNLDTHSVYLFDPETDEQVMLAENILQAADPDFGLWSITYEGDGEFIVTIPDEAVYRIRIARLTG